jgi:uncharacterized lipoprotein YmbA
VKFALRGHCPLAALAGLMLTSCGFLKPAHTPERRFVLTPLPPAPGASLPGNAPGLGVGQVKLPAYLNNTSIAVRRGTNEIDYLPLVLWAERLDTSVQRVLAGNLATLLPTDKVRLSAWRTDDVAVEVYVALERFDIDANGQAALTAWWRLVAPGGEKTLKSGQALLTRQGPAPDTDPAGAVATLSDVLADFSRQLAQVLQQTVPLPAKTAPK